MDHYYILSRLTLVILFICYLIIVNIIVVHYTNKRQCNSIFILEKCYYKIRLKIKTSLHSLIIIYICQGSFYLNKPLLIIIIVPWRDENFIRKLIVSYFISKCYLNLHIQTGHGVMTLIAFVVKATMQYLSLQRRSEDIYKLLEIERISVDRRFFHDRSYFKAYQIINTTVQTYLEDFTIER